MSDINWLDLSDRASVDPQELKRKIDLVAACLELGLEVEEQATGRFLGLCPFHDDHGPSFSVYDLEDGTQRCGCFACDFGPSNDVYDLLRALRGYGFAQALAEAQQLAAATRSTERPRRTRQAVDLTSMVEPARQRIADDQTSLRTFLSARNILVPAEWLIDQFGLGTTVDGGGVLVPHWSKDGELLGAKVRRGSTADRPWKPIAVEGSKLSELYGSWRDQGRSEVVLVEGESDTWTVSWLLRHADVDVLGLPSGAAARPRAEWLARLESRNVVLLFDGDDGGRTALRNWAAGLGVCRVGQIDEGLDPTSEKPERVLEAIAHAQLVGTAPAAGLVETPFGGYVRANDQNQAMIANFTLDLVRTIELEGEGHLFDVRLPDERVVSIASSDLLNDAKVRTWANRWGYVWHGATKDAQELLRMLVVRSVFCPRVRGTRVAGWSEGAFVFPEPHGTIGGRSWAYVPPVANMGVEKLIDLQPGQWDVELPILLAALHRPEVMTVVLGWIAAAPMRAALKAFPILGVVGAAGAGKSTIIRESLATFGWRMNTTLTATTPHAVASFAAATNTIPVWFDEYRRGAREDSRLVFEQVIRDAWESSSSWKGGLGENRQELRDLPARAPIVVSGEDAFSETSHLERMAVINLPRAGRNTEALERLYLSRRQGFGRAYLEWLVARGAAGTLPLPPAIPDRPRHVRAVVGWGYSIFELFANEVCGIDGLPPFDDSLVEQAHGHAEAHPVVLELIDVCDGRYGRGGPIVWREGNDYCIRLYDMLREARDLNIQLPGGARALRNELAERFGEVVDERDGLGPFLRVRRPDEEGGL